MKHMTSDAILDEMEKLFPDAHCELNHRSPFELLVAVVLSAQTTDASVNRVTPQLFEKFPTPQAMAQKAMRTPTQTPSLAATRATAPTPSPRARRTPTTR